MEEARFGVLYGGQIQRRKRIPFILERTRQQLGFRLRLSQPARSDLPVRWELDMPGRRIRQRDGTIKTLRRTRFGRETLPRGSKHLEVTTAFEPGDRLGDWHFRLWVGGAKKPALEHHFEVVRP